MSNSKIQDNPEIQDNTETQNTPVSFKRWCEDNGRHWIGAKNFKEFEKNANDYEKYRANFSKDKKIQEES